MKGYSFVSRWGRFGLLIAAFRLQCCWSSSGDEVDCLRVAVCGMLVRCYWCISILIIIPTIRCCSLTGPLCGWSAAVLFDRRYPSFRNFDSTISIDVFRMKTYMEMHRWGRAGVLQVAACGRSASSPGGDWRCCGRSVAVGGSGRFHRGTNE